MSTFGDGNATAEAIGYVLDKLEQLDMFGSADAIREQLLLSGHKGKAGDACACPVWKWVNEGAHWYGDLKEVVIGKHSCQVLFRSGGRMAFKTPANVGDFINQFDKGYYPELEDREAGNLD